MRHGHSGRQRRWRSYDCTPTMQGWETCSNTECFGRMQVIRVNQAHLGELLLQRLQHVVHGALVVLPRRHANHCLAVHGHVARLYPQLGRADGVAHRLRVDLEMQRTRHWVGFGQQWCGSGHFHTCCAEAALIFWGTPSEKQMWRKQPTNTGGPTLIAAKTFEATEFPQRSLTAMPKAHKHWRLFFAVD